MTWRLIVEGAQRGAWNMAVDEALAEAVDAASSAPVLRLYRWSPPCLSLGFAQPYEAADAGFCAAHGVDVVRRPTGGRAVLHHLELTYAVAAPLGPRPVHPRPAGRLPDDLPRPRRGPARRRGAGGCSRARRGRA